tara:strand:- start:517 stop:816 length:300 start_codon:yes stop_codon:yes gene_type:complete
MLKSELILNIHKKYPSLSINDIEKIIDLFFKKIFKSLVNKEKIEIRGFGTLSNKLNKEKYVRNPKTNEKFFKEATQKIHFKIGKTFHKKINDKNYLDNE